MSECSSVCADHTCWSAVTLHFTCVRKRKTQSWLICLSRDSSSVAALQLFVFQSIRTLDAKGKEQRVCVCVWDSTHRPTSLLRAVTQKHILGGHAHTHTHTHTLWYRFYSHSHSLNCDGRNEGLCSHSILLSLTLKHTHTNAQMPGPGSITHIDTVATVCSRPEQGRPGEAALQI